MAVIKRGDIWGVYSDDKLIGIQGHGWGGNNKPLAVSMVPIDVTLPAGLASLGEALPIFSKAVKLARGGVHTAVAVVRNSTGVGYSQTEGNVKQRAPSPVNVMAKHLRKLGVTVNTQNFMGDNNVAINGNTVDQYDPRCKPGAGWSTVSLGCPGANAFTNTTNANPFTFKCDAPVDRAVFFYVTNAGASPADLTVDVGGGVLATLTGNQAAAFRVSPVVDLAALALHSINVKATATTGCFFVGLMAWNSMDPGISVLNIGWDGANSSNFVDQSQVWRLFGGIPALTAAGVSLYITGEGINDGLGAVAAATRKANLTALVTQMQTSGGGADVILQSDPPSLTNRVAQAIQDAYAIDNLAIAQARGVPFLDSGAYLGGNDSATGAVVFSDDFGHLTRYGYALLGALPGAQLAAGIA